ncbi:MAG: virulence factor [Alphaproteobacteria bacterium]|nr:virulence factor [Alphaproteobacteria bacterium]
MAQMQIVYWRDIPAQVIVKKSRREQVKCVLDERFEKAIDRAAMKSGADSTDDYLSQWRKSDATECSDALEQEAQQIKEKLEAEYTVEKLSSLVKNDGYKTPD